MIQDLRLKQVLKCCYIIQGAPADGASLFEEAERAIRAGATLIQYGTAAPEPADFTEASSMRTLCTCNGVAFIIPEDILFAKAVKADGVHFARTSPQLELAREILGPHALIGVTLASEGSPVGEIPCDYLRLENSVSESFITEAGNLPVVRLHTGEPDMGSGPACCGIAVKDLNHIPAGYLSSRTVAHPWNDEFRLIEKLLARSPRKERVSQPERVPAGDDAALLAPIENPLITTDTQREGVHFRLEWQSPEEVGRKAVTATLSDLAASYAQPVSLFINLSLPSHMSEALAESIYKGVQQGLEMYGCSLGGGNLSSGDQLSLDLFAIGNGSRAVCPLRSNARPGDGLYATGPLGLAAAGLDLLFKNDFSFPSLVDKFKNPLARFDAAKILEANHVTCVMDISDGLMGDALHIAEASSVTIEFILRHSDLPPALKEYAGKYGRNPRDTMLSGGEDYELLFTCSEETFQVIKENLPQAFQVGRCLPFTGEHILNPPPGIKSFRHGSK